MPRMKIKQSENDYSNHSEAATFAVPSTRNFSRFVDDYCFHNSHQFEQKQLSQYESALRGHKSSHDSEADLNKISSSLVVLSELELSKKDIDGNNTEIIKFDKNIFSSNFLLREFLRNSQAAAYADNHRSYDSTESIYQNLCTGCGYGVFESKGNLCKFCQYVINGYFDNDDDENHIVVVDNIYENICLKCGKIFNGANDADLCPICQAIRNEELVFQNKITETPISKEEREKLKQLKSSKQQNRFFYGLFDTLKRARIGRKLSTQQKSCRNEKDSTKSSSSQSPRKLEIIHNVDGFDNVFHTKELFDLQKISKLKESSSQMNKEFASSEVNIIEKESKDQTDLEKTSIHNYEKPVYGKLRKYNNRSLNSVENDRQYAKTLNLRKISNTKSDPNLHRLKKSSSSLLFQALENRSKAPPQTRSNLSTSGLATLNYNKKPNKSYHKDSNSNNNLFKNNLYENFDSIQNKNKYLDEQTKVPDNYSNPWQKNYSKSLSDNDSKENQTIYLFDNVIDWIRGIRNQTFSYHSCYMDDSGYSIKSIPSKNNFDCCNCSFISSKNYFGLSSNSDRTTTCSTSTNNSDYPKYTQNIPKLHASLTTNEHNDQHKTVSPESKIYYSTASNNNENATRSQHSSIPKCNTTICSNNTNQQKNKFLNTTRTYLNNFIFPSTSSTNSSSTTLCLPVDFHAISKSYSVHSYTTNEQVFSTANSNNSDKKAAFLNKDQEKQQQHQILFDDYETILDEENINEYSDEYTRQMVDNFKQNLMEKQKCKENLKLRSKRRAIYLKPDDTDQLQFNHRTYNINSVINNSNINDLECISSNDQNSIINKGTLLSVSNRSGICENSNSEFFNDFLQSLDYSVVLKQEINPEILCNSVNTELNNINSEVKNDNESEENQIEKVINNNNNYSQPLEIIITNNNEIYLKNLNISNNTNLAAAQLYLKQIINFENLIATLTLSRCLNKIIIFYDKNLSIFLSIIQNTQKFSKCNKKCLLKFFKKFNSIAILKEIQYNKKITLKKENNFGASKSIRPMFINKSLAFVNVTQSLSTSTDNLNNKLAVNKIKKKPIPPPRRLLPQIPPALPPIPSVKPSSLTHPQKELKQLALATEINTVTPENVVSQSNKEEDIYQPIWKCQTLSNCPESGIQTSVTSPVIKISGDSKDSDQITREVELLTSSIENNFADDSSSTIEDTSEEVTINNAEEDHSEWETDDEFMFSTKMNFEPEINIDPPPPQSKDDNISLSTSSESTLIGETILYPKLETEISENNTIKTVGIDSPISWKTVCIIYSPFIPKYRKILYDYNSNEFHYYFSNNSGSSDTISLLSSKSIEASPIMQRNDVHSIAAGSTTPPNSDEFKRKVALSESVKNVFEPLSDTRQIDISSVEAWKTMLMDITYMEDEEDMFVSEDEILKLKEIEPDKPRPASLQRYKSISSDNLLDIPAQDKKSIGERFRNKLQRGVLKLNTKQIKDIKDTKKGKPIGKRIETKSLYLDEELKPKHPIFNAKLEDVEMHIIDSNVPRFVVDCIEMIEQKDCIQIDGLYRASGNKVAIDDIKKKLTESYIFYSKIMQNEDIHTVTGLLKLFFRELKTPLIPQEYYQKLPGNLVESSNLPLIKEVLNEIPQPSQGTLKYLLKHLTTVASHSSENRMPASNLAIVWGPCMLLSDNTGPFEIGRMNTLAKILIEKYDLIFGDDERLIN